MAIHQQHDLHRRRLGQNVGVALCLVGFAAIVFGLTISKLTSGGTIEGYDHVARPSLLPGEEASQ